MPDIQKVNPLGHLEQNVGAVIDLVAGALLRELGRAGNLENGAGEEAPGVDSDLGWSRTHWNSTARCFTNLQKGEPFTHFRWVDPKKDCQAQATGRQT